jgi:hypothetical protein
MHCQVLVARANKRGDYLAKFRCDDNLIQNYWFSLFNDRLYVSQTDTEPWSCHQMLLDPRLPAYSLRKKPRQSGRKCVPIKVVFISCSARLARRLTMWTFAALHRRDRGWAHCPSLGISATQGPVPEKIPRSFLSRLSLGKIAELHATSSKSSPAHMAAAAGIPDRHERTRQGNK